MRCDGVRARGVGAPARCASPPGGIVWSRSAWTACPTLEDCPVSLTTMGRALDDDEPAFLAAAAAGAHAASLTG